MYQKIQVYEKLVRRKFLNHYKFVCINYVRCFWVNVGNKYCRILVLQVFSIVGHWFAQYWVNVPQEISCKKTSVIVQWLELPFVAWQTGVQFPVAEHFQRKWFSGKIQRCHRWAPGSIPGLRIFLLFFVIWVQFTSSRSFKAT